MPKKTKYLWNVPFYGSVQIELDKDEFDYDEFIDAYEELSDYEPDIMLTNSEWEIKDAEILEEIKENK